MAVMTALAGLDEAATTWGGEQLAAWVRTGAGLGGRALRCPHDAAADVGADVADARRRLDLALRVLRGQAEAHWCREAGDGAVAVVLAWPLPARGIALVADGIPTTVVLGVGGPGGQADLWRFHLDRPGDLTGRVRGLLAAADVR